MSRPKGGLGRGLGSLIPPTIAPAAGTEAAKAAAIAVTELSPDVIVVNPHQPRTHFAEEHLDSLKSSIKEHGILQPLILTDNGDGTYELIAGERRLRSARALGLDQVPVVVRTATEQQKLELALIENIQRHDLNAVEEAKAYQSLADQFSLTQESVAERVGKSRPHVANTMRLLDLDEVILEALSMQNISRSHARTLLQESDLDARLALFEQMLKGDMTVREAEVRAGAGKRSSVRAEKDPNIAAIEAELREVLGTKVSLKMRGTTGKMTIHFYSKDDLKGLIERLKD